MQSLKLSHVLMAGTSLAVLSFAILNIGQLHRSTFEIRDHRTAARRGEGAGRRVDAPRGRTAQGCAGERRRCSCRAIGEAVSPTKMKVAAAIARTPPARLHRWRRESLGCLAADGAEADQQRIYYRGPGPRQVHRHRDQSGEDRADEPVSTFSIDVDTASYCLRARRAQPECAAAEGCGARRGDDQLFPL